MAYTMKEIVDIAIGIEETGYQFYTSHGKKLKETALAAVFEFLANEELAHKNIFISLKDIKNEIGGVFTEEYYLYLKAIGGERIFGSQKNEDSLNASAVTSPLSAIKMAFTLEKDSILFYSEMKKLYPDSPKPVELIDKIITEEQKHIAILYDLSQKIRLT